MLRANRSLWWILLVGILILGCCCIAFAGGLFAFYSFRRGLRQRPALSGGPDHPGHAGGHGACACRHAARDSYRAAAR